MIHPATELRHVNETIGYGTLNLQEDFVCACPSPKCRQIIRTDDMERHAAAWDAVVEPIFRSVQASPQPLWLFLREQEVVEQALANRTPYRSIHLNYRPRAGVTHP